MQTIQIIEDSGPIRTMLADFLAGSGYRTLESENGTDALNLLSKETPDLILLDIWMPYMNGYEVIKKIRQREKTTPVIIISSKGLEDDAEKGYALGADGYFVKPFSLKDLLTHINSVLI